MLVGHVGHLPDQAMSARLIAFTHDKSQYQPPNRGKGQPHPGIPIAVQIVLCASQVFLLSVDKTPQCIPLTLGRGEVPPQGQHHRAARSNQPLTRSLSTSTIRAVARNELPSARARRAVSNFTGSVPKP